MTEVNVNIAISSLLFHVLRFSPTVSGLTSVPNAKPVYLYTKRAFHLRLLSWQCSTIG